ncbi:KamA family protein [Methanohalophilus levihalophilus]|uniref:KamA family radical SAM protein n=1 Tax=Methanohalophilus levihalophilus TaxID=1431282 RepID=UPI001AE8CA2B|nr:KamA family radical SAM protein [Methanohalophilus levihalophilus]MBP2031066.1 KamA family protein [Methanohalophilus levihalophilus]
MSSPQYVTTINDLDEIDENERNELKKVEAKFAFRSNDYYMSLIDWDDPNDPIRRIIIPDPAELEGWGKLNASAENKYTVVRGLEHKYKPTALLLVSDICGGFCRYCFRKRLFMDENREVNRDISDALSYISNHTEITNVLLSGGDPLLLPTKQLEDIVKSLREIDHVQIVRIGSKMLTFNPHRVLNDPSLPEMISKYSTKDKRIYIATQFNHPRELSDVVLKSINILQESGATIVNQTPILRGVNDNPDTLAKLFKKLSFNGVMPYYVFQCRPTLGNRHFVVPVEESYRIFERAKAQCSGLAKKATFAMSHMLGKIAVMGVDDDHTYLKFHQAANSEDIGKLMVFRKNPKALWFDDYVDLVSETKVV